MEKRKDSEFVHRALELLADEARDLYLDRNIAELNSVPEPLAFYRNFVSPNKPLVLRSVLNWPAINKWNTDYLREAVGDEEVSVAVTPSGYADAVHDSYFVMPEERVMLFKTFLDKINDPTSTNGVFYVQKQNSNFTTEFGKLLQDAALDIPWASEAFGKQPDAVNFWMGDERAVTSLHKDHYENLYCVVKGWKQFTLIAPTDQSFVPYEEYQPAYFKETSDGEFHIEPDLNMKKVPWISVDPLNPDLRRHPSFSRVTRYEVTVRAGDILYLPSLWIHHVQQSHGCIAVNFWYDMEFDIKFNYFKLVEKLTKHLSLI